MFSYKELLDELTTERVLEGVATRGHADVAERLGAEIDDEDKGTGR